MSLEEAWACLKHRTLIQGPSLQLEQAVRLETGELEAQEPKGLVRQSVELRRQLQEEQASYRRKLQAYQEGQQRQAQLVQRLQAKVRAAHPYPCPLLHSALIPGLTRLPARCQILQYKKQCSELEKQLLEKSTELEEQRLRVGARWGRHRPRSSYLALLLSSSPRTQNTVRTWTAPFCAWRRSSRGEGGAQSVGGLLDK